MAAFGSCVNEMHVHAYSCTHRAASVNHGSLQFYSWSIHCLNLSAVIRCLAFECDLLRPYELHVEHECSKAFLAARSGKAADP